MTTDKAAATCSLIHCTVDFDGAQQHSVYTETETEIHKNSRFSLVNQETQQQLKSHQWQPIFVTSSQPCTQ